MKSIGRSWEKYSFVEPSGPACPWSEQGDLAPGWTYSPVAEEERRCATVDEAESDRELHPAINPFVAHPAIRMRLELPESYFA